MFDRLLCVFPIFRAFCEYHAIKKLPFCCEPLIEPFIHIFVETKALHSKCVTQRCKQVFKGIKFNGLNWSLLVKHLDYEDITKSCVYVHRLLYVFTRCWYYWCWFIKIDLNILYTRRCSVGYLIHMLEYSGIYSNNRPNFENNLSIIRFDWYVSRGNINYFVISFLYIALSFCCNLINTEHGNIFNLYSTYLLSSTR